MFIMQIDQLKKSYGERQLFNEVSFSIHEGDKIGLIGVNGTGKTSLLKALAGIEPADAGQVVIPKGVKVSYLSQNPEYRAEQTILETIFDGSSPLLSLIRDYEASLEKLEQNPTDEKCQRSTQALQNRMDATQAWEVESQIKSILTQLNIHEFDKPMGQLSGGQKKRVALAEALISDSQLLILDEPTNHMDSQTVEWLEGVLKQRKGALLIVTHDRYFLDRVVNKTIELDQGRLFTYTGSYSWFVEQKALRQELENATARKQQNLYKRELEWIRAGAQARSTKQKARIDRFGSLKDQMGSDSNADKMEVSVAHSRLGSKIIEMTNVCKSFDDLLIIKDFTYTMVKSDRIGIVGPSGIGKTTLLKLMLKEIPQDSGEIDHGITVNVGYFSQDAELLPAEKRAIDWIRETAEFVTTGDGIKISASQMMERFLFDSHLQYTYIGRLSGGERRRLYLLQVLMTSPNVLILDEPTNDLDIDTLKVLEDYLDDFQGAVVVISHDRYFLDRTCERIWSFEQQGQVYVHTGNYTEYLEHIKDPLYNLSDSELSAIALGKTLTKTAASTNAKSSTQNTAVKASATSGDATADDARQKLTFKEQHELKTIDFEVETLEVELQEIEAQMEKAATNFEQLALLSQKKEAVEERLLEKMDRQEYLHRFDA